MKSYEFRSVLLIPQAHLGRAKAQTEGFSGSGRELVRLYIYLYMLCVFVNFLLVIGVCIIYCDFDIGKSVYYSMYML